MQQMPESAERLANSGGKRAEPRFQQPVAGPAPGIGKAEALRRDKQSIGGRYIDVFACSQTELQARLAGDFA